MNNSVTLPVVLALTFLLTLLAVGGSGSAGAFHNRGVQAANDQQCQMVVHVDNGSQPVMNAEIFMRSNDRSKDCSGKTASNGKAYFQCWYATYTITVKKEGFEDYSEEDYEVNEPHQIKKINLSETSSDSMAIVAAPLYSSSK